MLEQIKHWAKKLSPQPLPDTLVCLDTETTSLNVAEAELLSIGAVRIRNGVIQGEEKLDILVTSPKAERRDEEGHSAIPIHRILPNESQRGIPIDQALSSLRLFIGKAPITGYHIDFDRRMLEKVLGHTLENRFIEVSDLFYKRQSRRQMSSAPGGHIDLSFDHICKTLDVPVLSRHSALGDAITTAMLYLKLRE